MNNDTRKYVCSQCKNLTSNHDIYGRILRHDLVIKYSRLEHLKGSNLMMNVTTNVGKRLANKLPLQ